MARIYQSKRVDTTENVSGRSKPPQMYSSAPVSTKQPLKYKTRAQVQQEKAAQYTAQQPKGYGKAKPSPTIGTPPAPKLPDYSVPQTTFSPIDVGTYQAWTQRMFAPLAAAAEKQMRAQMAAQGILSSTAAAGAIQEAVNPLLTEAATMGSQLAQYEQGQRQQASQFGVEANRDRAQFLEDRRQFGQSLALESWKAKSDARLSQRAQNLDYRSTIYGVNTAANTAKAELAENQRQYDIEAQRLGEELALQRKEQRDNATLSAWEMTLGSAAEKGAIGGNIVYPTTPTQIRSLLYPTGSLTGPRGDAMESYAYEPMTYPKKGTGPIGDAPLPTGTKMDYLGLPGQVVGHNLTDAEILARQEAQAAADRSNALRIARIGAAGRGSGGEQDTLDPWQYMAKEMNEKFIPEKQLIDKSADAAIAQLDPASADYEAQVQAIESKRRNALFSVGEGLTTGWNAMFTPILGGKNVYDVARDPNDPNYSRARGMMVYMGLMNQQQGVASQASPPSYTPMQPRMATPIPSVTNTYTPPAAPVRKTNWLQDLISSRMLGR